ncbi:MAG: isochorismatase family protein [Solimonas sp.]
MSIPQLGAYALPEVLPASRAPWQPDARRAVLLIHDMQDYFLRYYGDANPLIERVLANIARLRGWARARGVPVVYTAQPAQQSAAQRALLNDVWGPGLTTADPALQAIVAPLAPDSDDTVLTKWRYSAFQRTDLEARMQRWQRNQLIIVGVYAHIGCLTTALDAFMRDIQPFIVADAVADFSADEHRMALQYVAGRCGVVLDTAQLLNVADRAAAEDEPGVEWLRREVLPHLDDGAGLGEHDNLLDYGLSSVQLMQLVGRWEKRGLALRFEELAETPTLAAWATLIARREAEALA